LCDRLRVVKAQAGQQRRLLTCKRRVLLEHLHKSLLILRHFVDVGHGLAHDVIAAVDCSDWHR
jgi:hypothetical protein